MKIHFFERKYLDQRVSIEKVFSVVKSTLVQKKFEVKSLENPYPLSRFLSSLIFFSKRQGDVNHITGDIHWVSLFLDSRRTVLTIHDMVGLRNYKSKFKRWFYLLFWFYLPLKKVRYVTVISQKTKDEIISTYPWAENKIRVIGNPLTCDIYRKAPRVDRDVRIKILVVGTRENKNLDRILDATNEIPCDMVVIGLVSSDQNNKIHCATGNVIVKEYVTDAELVDLYKTCDLLCFPSLYEGFGMPIIEAQANGCAEITSNFEPMKSVAGGAALLVDPYNIIDIRDKILLLMYDEKLRNDFIEQGYLNAEMYSPCNISAQYLNLYKEILNG